MTGVGLFVTALVGAALLVQRRPTLGVFVLAGAPLAIG